MALKEIAVEGLTLSPQGIVSIGAGTLSIISIASVNSKIDGNGIYSASLQFTLVGANAVGYDPGTVMTTSTGVISATALYSKADGSAVVRVNDSSSTIAMTGTISGTPTPFVEPWGITNANQTKVKAE